MGLITMFLSPQFVLSVLSLFCTSLADNCNDFEDVTCELSEHNIIDLDRHTPTPGECQVMCRETEECGWFTHFGTDCYLLRDCGVTEHCGGCVSGPTSPDFATCPWPPGPAPETTTTTTTSSTTTQTTTISTTTTTTTTPTTTTTTGGDASCSNFEEAACELSENNIVGHDRFTNTATECQEKCKEDAACSWFTHFDTQCYLLSTCGNTAQCQGCVSGPTSPDFSSCPWPPGPEPSTTTSSSTKPTTTTTKSTTTTTRTTSTTTTQTTSTASEQCDDIKINENCDWSYGLIHWYENVMTGSECQHICLDLQGAKFFSHYNEGREAEHGFCGCFSTCAWPSSEGCYDRCATHEVFSEEDWIEDKANYDDLTSSETFGGELDVEEFALNEPRPGPRYCHCMRGPLQPDVDGCDLWP